MIKIVSISIGATLLTLMLGFYFFIIPSIEIKEVIYQSNNSCIVKHTMPSLFQLNDKGIQQNTINITGCQNEILNKDLLLKNLVLKSEEAYSIPILPNFKKYYKESYFFYFENTNFKYITNIIESNTFIFEDLSVSYDSNFHYLEDLKESVFEKTQEKQQNEILVTLRVKPNNDIEVSYKYNNNENENKQFIKQLINKMLENSKEVILKKQ